MKPKPVPDGYDTIIPYLVIRNADAGIEFYKKLFGAVEVTRMNYPDKPTVIMHAELKVRGKVLMLAEENSEFGMLSPLALNSPPPVSVMLYVEDVDDVFNRAVSLGSQPLMPPMDAFWGDRFGKFSDPFGHHWAVATHQKDLTPEEIAKGAQEWAKQCPEA